MGLDFLSMAVVCVSIVVFHIESHHNFVSLIVFRVFFQGRNVVVAGELVAFLGVVVVVVVVGGDD